jgi:hypothetical protein
MPNKMKKIILSTIALISALVWTGCQKENQMEDDPVPQDVSVKKDSVWTISVRAVKGSGQSEKTKGLDLDGGEEATTTTLQSIWKVEDEVKVFLGTDCIGTLGVVPDNVDPHTSVLYGTVSLSNVTPGVTRLTFLTPRQTIDYTGQMGNLFPAYGVSNPIEQNYHYTIAQDVLVTEAYAANITTDMATFEPIQSVYRMNFRFQKGGVGDKTAITTKSVNISGAAGHLVQNQSLDGSEVTEGDIHVSLQWATTNPFFVALRNGDETNEEVFTFTVVDEDGATYRGTKAIPAAYKPNGSFVSMKNTTLTSRLEVPLSATTVDTVL